MTSTIGIPIKLLNEATGHIVTVEITSGNVYRGKLLEAEDNMNCQLRDITVTARDGRVSHLDQVYIRGSHVRYFIVPDMLRNNHGDQAPTSNSSTRQTRLRHLSRRQRWILSSAHTFRRIIGSSIATDLTGSAPTPDASTGSLAGITHEWILKTAYYTAAIPIWIDEIGDVEAWTAEFLKPEAQEVVQALGGWIYCFNNGKKEDGDEVTIPAEVEKTIKAVSDVVERACGMMWDGTRLAIDLTPSNKDKATVVVEEQCLDLGFEYIHVDAEGKNEYGEKLGLERAREVLEANEWSSSAAEDEDEDGIGGIDDEQAQMNAELWGLKASLLDADNEGVKDEGSAFQLESMEQMMSQLMAIKETTAGMPEDERKRYAARAVDDLMKDFV
ncbi:hypothetical protein E4T43_06260 [Aureobasidium subglaciale]|nr:hypothetical protein E4T43_06260 [Aureobasidium subglaciale]